MSSIKTIIQEEFERLVKLQKRYEEEISQLPVGSLSIKKRSGKEYAYIAYREKEKVKTDYIGTADSSEVEKLRGLILKRKELEELLRATKKRLKEVEKVLDGKKI